MLDVVQRLARLLAQIGGLTLMVMILLVCVSVLGRSLNGILHSDLLQDMWPAFSNWLLALGIGPVNGDFEIVEACMAFAIFAFLPICQLTGAHASVDVFAASLPAAVSGPLRLIIEVVFAAVLILLAWQLTLGGMSKYRSGQTTLLLEFPVWWSYAASIVAMWVAALVGVYVAWLRADEVIRGRANPLSSEGPSH